MSKKQLIELLQVQLDDESDSSSRRNRQFNTAKQGNSQVSQTIGGPVFEYLDTVYIERVKDLYEDRIKKLEDRVEALQKKVK